MQYCEPLGHSSTNSFQVARSTHFTCREESHLSGVLRTNSHAKFSPNEGVIDEICNILKVLSIILTEREKEKRRMFRV